MQLYYTKSDQPRNIVIALPRPPPPLRPLFVLLFRCVFCVLVALPLTQASAAFFGSTCWKNGWTILFGMLWKPSKSIGRLWQPQAAASAQESERGSEGIVVVAADGTRRPCLSQEGDLTPTDLRISRPLGRLPFDGAMRWRERERERERERGGRPGIVRNGFHLQ